MFIEYNTPIRAITRDGKFYEGKVFNIVIEYRQNPTTSPDTIVFISTDPGCVFLHLSDIEKIEVL